MNIKKKIFLNLACVILLFAMLAGATYALLFYTVAVEDNLFETGTVRIDLNNGEKVFNGSEMNIAPGGAVSKPMVLKNLSSGPVWYRLYIENVSGPLADALMFHIYDENGVLLKSAAAKDFTSENALVSGELLDVDAEVTLRIEAAMNDCAGNEYEDRFIIFDIIAKAVQSKNNPDKEF